MNNSRIGSGETGSAVLLHSRMNLLMGFLPISAAASIYLYRQSPSGQSRVYQFQPAVSVENEQIDTRDGMSEPTL